jgi:hypothetical protein
MNRKRRIGWLAAVVTTVLVTPVVGIGGAEAALLATEGRTGTLTLAPGASGSTILSCRSSSWAAVSGGFATDVADEVMVNASRPSGNGWFVSAVNRTATTRTVQVQALCAVIDGRVVRARTALVAPMGSPDVTATCPAGTTSAGGGYQVDPVDRLPVTSTRPAANGTGWTVTAFNATTGTRSVTAYTVCAVFNGRQVMAAGTALPPGNTTTLTATCPPNKVVLGGGWAHGGGVEWLVTRASPQSIFVYAVRFVNNQPPINFGITTFVVCSSVGPIPSVPPPAR